MHLMLPASHTMNPGSPGLSMPYFSYGKAPAPAAYSVHVLVARSKVLHSPRHASQLVVAGGMYVADTRAWAGR